tara:strand:- start:239 stop:409 length:171 start_codon:yes stop_codon:yes gene_type:complete
MLAGKYAWEYHIEMMACALLAGNNTLEADMWTIFIKLNQLLADRKCELHYILWLKL